MVNKKTLVLFSVIAIVSLIFLSSSLSQWRSDVSQAEEELQQAIVEVNLSVGDLVDVCNEPSSSSSDVVQSACIEDMLSVLNNECAQYGDQMDNCQRVESYLQERGVI